jgi:hypothetical protein
MFYSQCTFAAMAVAVVISASALAAEDAGETTHAGQVISIHGNKLKMTIKGDKDLLLTVSEKAKILLDGKACDKEDLKAGMRIRAITSNEAPDIAVRIQAIDKYLEFENTYDGKLVTLAGDKLEMAADDGQIHRRTLAANIKITCDGKDCKAENLKKGMRLRVTIERVATPPLTTRIEALDKNDEFEKRD